MGHNCIVEHQIFWITWLFSFLQHEQLCEGCNSYRNSVCLSVRQSVCLSVCHTRALWQDQTMHCGCLDITQKGNHSSFLTPTVVGWRCLFCLKSALKMTHPFEKHRLRQISAHNVSTVRDGKKVQLWSRLWAFQRAIDGVHMLPLSPPKGGSKTIFCFCFE